MSSPRASVVRLTLETTFIFFIVAPPPNSTLFPYTTLFRSRVEWLNGEQVREACPLLRPGVAEAGFLEREALDLDTDRKSTRLNSSHSQISYAVFCLKKKIFVRLEHSLIFWARVVGRPASRQ